MHTLISRLREKREQGFTLVELLVVILIVGILSAVAIPMFMNQRKAAVESTIQSDLKNASTLVTGKMTNQGYPDTLPAGVAMSEGVQLSYYSNGKSYCIKGEHQDIKSSWYYDSTLDGMSQNSCSVRLDSQGDFYTAEIGHSVIYAGAGTWGPHASTGPSGEPVQLLRHNPGADRGWGIFGAYNLSNGIIPAGSTVKVSYYLKGEGIPDSPYSFHIVNNGYSQQLYPQINSPASPSWKRMSHTLVTQHDWVPGVHFIRFGLYSHGNEAIYISDVQVDIIQASN